jgi:hypothetical protein
MDWINVHSQKHSFFGAVAVTSLILLLSQGHFALSEWFAAAGAFA